MEAKKRKKLIVYLLLFVASFFVGRGIAKVVRYFEGQESVETIEKSRRGGFINHVTYY
jgi:hypothetical protein